MRRLSHGTARLPGNGYDVRALRDVGARRDRTDCRRGTDRGQRGDGPARGEHDAVGRGCGGRGGSAGGRLPGGAGLMKVPVRLGLYGAGLVVIFAASAAVAGAVV